MQFSEGAKSKSSGILFEMLRTFLYVHWSAISPELENNRIFAGDHE